MKKSFGQARFMILVMQSILIQNSVYFCLCFSGKVYMKREKEIKMRSQFDYK